MRGPLRHWPLLLALAGVAALAWAGVRLARPVPEEFLEEEDADEPPPQEPGQNEHFEDVRRHEIDEFATYRGVVEGEGRTEVRAPQGMRVAVIQVHKEAGEFVAKGDPLITFDAVQIEKAIEEAEKAGRKDDAERYREFLDHVTLRSPVDGTVFEVWAEQGGVPFDVGIPLMTLAGRDEFTFRVQVPDQLLGTALHMGARAAVELDETRGTVQGTVTGFADPVAGEVNVVVGLDPHEGLEKGLGGSLRVPASKREVGLVPKTAVRWREGVAVVRVWEPDDRTVAERTIVTRGELGDDLIVLYGVAPGDDVVVPGAVREP